MTMARGSLTAPLACTFFEQETDVRATVEARFEIIAEKITGFEIVAIMFGET